MQVTPSPVTVTLTKLLWHNQHRDFASGEERSTGGLALPGDFPVTGHTSIPTVCWLGIGSLQTKTQTETQTQTETWT